MEEENKPDAIGDNRRKAVFLTNIFALFATIHWTLFWYLAKDGVSVIQICLFKNLLLGVLAAIQMCFKKQNPFTGYSTPVIQDLIMRAIAGQITFALMYYSLTLLPGSTAIICIWTYPFWTILLACLVHEERPPLVEVVGISLCFAGVGLFVWSLQEQQAEQEEKLVGKNSKSRKALGIAMALAGAWTLAV